MIPAQKNLLVAEGKNTPALIVKIVQVLQVYQGKAKQLKQVLTVFAVSQRIVLEKVVMLINQSTVKVQALEIVAPILHVVLDVENNNQYKQEQQDNL